MKIYTKLKENKEVINSVVSCIMALFIVSLAMGMIFISLTTREEMLSVGDTTLIGFLIFIVVSFLLLMVYAIYMNLFDILNFYKEEKENE